MGDRRRFAVFARYLREAFPEAVRVADVGGGRGLLSIELRELGLAPTIIDPRLTTNLPHRVRKALRKEALRTGRVPRLPRFHARVEEVDLSEFDVIAGLHPDQATEPIVRQSVQAEKPFAVVPCCVMPLDGLGRSYDEWVAYLAGLAPGSWRMELPMEGARTVICWRGLPVLPSNPVRSSSDHRFLGHLESGARRRPRFGRTEYEAEAAYGIPDRLCSASGRGEGQSRSSNADVKMTQPEGNSCAVRRCASRPPRV